MHCKSPQPSSHAPAIPTTWKLPTQKGMWQHHFLLSDRCIWINVYHEELYLITFAFLKGRTAFGVIQTSLIILAHSTKANEHFTISTTLKDIPPSPSQQLRELVTYQRHPPHLDFEPQKQRSPPPIQTHTPTRNNETQHRHRRHHNRPLHPPDPPRFPHLVDSKRVPQTWGRWQLYRWRGKRSLEKMNDDNEKPEGDDLEGVLEVGWQSSHGVIWQEEREREIWSKDILSCERRALHEEEASWWRFVDRKFWDFFSSSFSFSHIPICLRRARQTARTDTKMLRRRWHTSMTYSIGKTTYNVE